MSTIVAVEEFKVKGKHGVFDYEREKEQPFVIKPKPISTERSKRRFIRCSPRLGDEPIKFGINLKLCKTV